MDKKIVIRDDYNDGALFENGVLFLEDDSLRIAVPSGQRVTISDNRFGAVKAMRTITLTVEEGAHVLWQSRHQLSDCAKVSTFLTVHVMHNATFEATWVQMGGALSSLEYDVRLEGVGAQARFIGRYTGEKESYHSVTVLQQHKKANSHSFVDIRALVADASKFLYEGTIMIGQNAAGSTAFQEQKNIVIGKEASVRSVPNLEVLTNEVQCGHGSAVSCVQEEQLWYLKARGISALTARQMIIDGFLAF